MLPTFPPPSIASMDTRDVRLFVGRGGEMEKIMEFWRGTYEAQGLRAGLLVGEAGVDILLLDRPLPAAARAPRSR